MNQIKLFIELTRLEKPIGYMLLFWPCAWGLTLAYDFTDNLDRYFYFFEKKNVKIFDLYLQSFL